MSWSLVAAAVWFIAANLRAMFPSKDHLWRFAYGMIALGMPILIWVAVDHGIWIAALVFVAACSVLRWPVIYTMRWIRRMRAGGADEA